MYEPSVEVNIILRRVTKCQVSDTYQRTCRQTHSLWEAHGIEMNHNSAQLCPSWFLNCGPPQHFHLIPSPQSIQALCVCVCVPLPHRLQLCGVTWVSCQMVALLFEVGFHFNNCHILASGRNPPHVTKKRKNKITCTALFVGHSLIWYGQESPLAEQKSQNLRGLKCPRAYQQRAKPSIVPMRNCKSPGGPTPVSSRTLATPSDSGQTPASPATSPATCRRVITADCRKLLWKRKLWRSMEIEPNASKCQELGSRLIQWLSSWGFHLDGTQKNESGAHIWSCSKASWRFAMFFTAAANGPGMTGREKLDAQGATTNFVI